MEEKRYKIYRNEDKLQGCVQIVHGMSEYKERYEYFIEKLNKAGYAVIAHDHLGHGSSCKEEDLGYFSDKLGWDKVIEECHEVTTIMKSTSEYKDVPYILFGHSMGSIIARSYLKRYANEIDALILSGPPFYNPAAYAGKLIAKINQMIFGPKHISKFVEGMFTGDYESKFDNPRGWLSKNEENVTNYDNDPLCGYSFTNSAYKDMATGVIDMHVNRGWNKSNLSLPILIVGGEDDPCVGGHKGSNVTIKDLQNVGYKNIKKILFPNLRHEILNEIERDDVITDILEFINTNKN